MHCLYGGYNLHQFSDALGLVIFILRNRSMGDHSSLSNDMFGFKLNTLIGCCLFIMLQKCPVI